MDWGIQLPQMGMTGRDEILAFARAVECVGFHSGWVSDHVCWPAEIESEYPYTDDGSFPVDPGISWLEPIATQLFVAGCTSSLRLGFSVLILPYRLPVLTAKQLASLDVLSGGRLILGCGVGWMREEAEILGVPFDHRGERMNEQLGLFSTLFRDRCPSHRGRFYELPPVAFEPKPLQDPVPVWVGGSSEPSYRRAARLGTGFHAIFEGTEVLKRQWNRVREEAELIGRDPDELTLSIRVPLDPEGVTPQGSSIHGSTQRMHDRIGQLTEIGVSHVLLDPVTRDGGIFGGVDARLKMACSFMEEVGLAYR